MCVTETGLCDRLNQPALRIVRSNMWQVWDIWVDLKVQYHLGDQGTHWKVKLQWILNKGAASAWIGLMWLGIGTSDGLLSTR